MAEPNTNLDTISTEKIVDARGVPLGNILAEIQRKLGRTQESVNAKLDMILQGNRVADKAPIDPPVTIDTDIKQYVDSQLAPFKEDKQTTLLKAQKASLDSVFKTFPELNKNSDEFDNQFFDLAVEFEEKMDASDPQRPLKAAKLAALELGKLEKLTKAKVLQDENRRNRILSEGSAPSKETSKASGKKLDMNNKAIKQFLKIDPAKIEQVLKDEE